MTKEEKYQYILYNHMGRWHVDNIPLFKKSSRLSKCPIKIYKSCEKDFIWLIRVDKFISYKEFWVNYKILLMEENN